MKKILNILGTVAVIVVILALAYLKWWNVFGQSKLDGSCSNRGGCRSFWCLAHEKVGDKEQKTEGYCTDSCDTDSDCKTGMACVLPTPEALDDLAAHGRPKKLCERTR